MDLLAAGASIAVILTAVIGGVVGFQRRRAHRLIPFDTAYEWRSTLHTVDYIFQTSLSQGGGQDHPWVVHGETYDETRVQHLLDNIKEGARDEELQDHVAELKSTVRELYASCHDPGPWVHVLGQETQADRDRWALIDKFRSIQTDVANRGHQQVQATLNRLNTRSARR